MSKDKQVSWAWSPRPITTPSGDKRGILRRARNDKWLTRGALWGAIHTVFARQLESHADWRLIRYEALCGDPIGQFETLAQEFGLELGHSTRQKITAICTTDNPDPGSTQRNSRSMPDIWRQRMSPDEIDAVMGIVGEFGLGYYMYSELAAQAGLSRSPPCSYSVK